MYLRKSRSVIPGCPKTSIVQKSRISYQHLPASMPKFKLKSALGAHQADAARRAAEAKKAENKARMAAAAKHSTAEKRALKRQRRERDAAVKAIEEERAAQRAKDLAEEVGDEEEEEEDVEEEAMDEDVDEEDEASDDEATVERKVAMAALLARTTMPIASDDTVLLLGEANFSFARALIEGRSHAGHLVCATAYDSEAECYEKYPDAKKNIEMIRAAGARVGFNVDGGALEKSHKIVGKGPRWSRIVFNFPHVGKGITDQDRNVRENQVLLLRTLKSVKPLLTEGPSAFPLQKVKGKKAKVVMRGKANNKASRRPREVSPVDDDEEVAEDDEKVVRVVPASFTSPYRQGTFLVTLLHQAPYTHWELSKLATKPPAVCPGTHDPQPRYRLIRSFEFVPDAWPGYAHRRTIGWREGLSKKHNEEILGRQGKAKTWEFCVWDGDE